MGFNYRMTDVQAAIGLVQLGKLDRLVARRRELAQRYQQLLADMPGLRTITDPDYGTTNYQSFWVLLPMDFPVSRDELLRRLAEAGVSARRGIMAAHLEPAYADLAHDPLPVTERLTARSLILPLFHDLTEAEQDLVISVLAAAGQSSESCCIPGRSSRDGNAWRKNLVLVGAGGFGRETAEAVRALNATGTRSRLLGYTDQDPRGPGLSSIASCARWDRETE